MPSLHPHTGVLLINLGTPADPSPAAVRRFLGEFLSDPRVIDYPRVLWLPLLYGVILRIRPKRSAAAYAQIWTPEGSPLMVESKRLAAALQNTLGPTPVALGMTYGAPSIESALRELDSQGVRRIVVIPLYPQYSTTTTAPAFDKVVAALTRLTAKPEMRWVEHYYSEPTYLDALAASVRRHWTLHPRRHLMFSFHGLPRRYVDNGDPYYDHCVATARGTAQRLNLNDSDWSIAFQSRVGREKWLEPYTDVLLKQYATKGPKEVSVICPAFATECLETLEEIAIRNREDFLAAGGASFDYIPCLNADPAHVDVFARLVRERLDVHSSTEIQSDAALQEQP